MSEILQFLYKIQPARGDMLAEGPTPQEDRIITEHFSYLKGLAEEGLVILAGWTLNTDSSSFGIVILQAGSEQDARAIMNADPAVRAGVMIAELFPYRIALTAKTFEG